MIAVLVLVAWFALSVRAGLARNGIGFDMGFLSQVAGFDLSEGYALTTEGLRRFMSSDSNAQALLAGFINTVKTASVAIILTTVLGTLVGMGRVSHNWIVRQLCFGFVEMVRNTPMLIQLVFWYFVVILKLPALADAASWLGTVIASQQGFYFPGVELAPEATLPALLSFLAGLVLLVAGAANRRHRKWLTACSLAGLVSAWAIGFPVAVTVPHVTGFVITGGFSASPEFAAMLVGLTVYTSAFIAEIIRGAIVALPKGQWEAASALGLSRGAAFRDIVIPQVFRVVLPAFGNQYISLAKTTSLGIAIGFPDVFNVYGTVANQSGRSLEGVIVVMLAYLILSWTISGAVNLLNGLLLRNGGKQ
ncbi:ABC transporter permease subunit [Variovorax ginsengisoli]|uniref:His/Glu/Gln/Arg/opine family amino acid ABC transporter permease subunit n=1 Tax=Variovorax ginsengisoli TaxID=363844 RepID=A0ABT9SHX0_9BURK|nr:ABC transporter permease subunit [Variovorax ginsengisoli]MDP9903002.1 His/Glu/Gln/Arg/opine family amino acid ABC transporter permease subunit [Variovorax ginsengisoli]